MWAIGKGLQIALDNKIKEIKDLPYTLSYVIRKRMQIDNLSELGSEKKPPEEMIWEGTPEEIEDWLDRVIKGTGKKELEFIINEEEVD